MRTGISLRTCNLVIESFEQDDDAQFKARSRQKNTVRANDRHRHLQFEAFLSKHRLKIIAKVTNANIMFGLYKRYTCATEFRISDLFF